MKWEVSKLPICFLALIDLAINLGVIKLYPNVYKVYDNTRYLNLFYSNKVANKEPREAKDIEVDDVVEVILDE